MDFIIGGAYQGKQTYAVERYSLQPEEIFTCMDRNIDFSKRCISHLEVFTLACVRAGIEPLNVFAACPEQWRNSVLICQDLFCGVVPMEAELREWRNATGRLCQYLSREADSVVRIFCGLEQKLK